MTTPLAPGTLVVVGRRIGRIVKQSNRGRATGYDVQTTPETRLEGTAPHFIEGHDIRVAERGVNVCPTPRGECWCGLVHVARPELLEGADA